MYTREKSILSSLEFPDFGLIKYRENTDVMKGGNEVHYKPICHEFHAPKKEKALKKQQRVKTCSHKAQIYVYVHLRSLQ